MESPWLTLTQAGSYVHRGKRFLAREVAAGRLRAARIGGRGEILTRREWLDSWVTDQATPVIVTGVRKRA
jgi:hypothetical protein